MRKDPGTMDMLKDTDRSLNDSYDGDDIKSPYSDYKNLYNKKEDEFEKSEIERLERMKETGMPKIRSEVPPTPKYNTHFSHELKEPYSIVWDGFEVLFELLRDFNNLEEFPKLGIEANLLKGVLEGIFVQKYYISRRNYCKIIDCIFYKAEYDREEFTIVENILFKSWIKLIEIYRINIKKEEHFNESQKKLFRAIKRVLLKEIKIKRMEYFEILKMMY